MYMQLKCKNLMALPLVFAIIALLSGCGGGGILQVSDIQGDGSINENTSLDYTINVSGDKLITYMWTLDPPNAGELSNEATSSVSFYAYEVTANTPAKLTVNINSKKHGPIIATREILITDTNLGPTAAAHCDNPRIGHGQSATFGDDSTDPEGEGDIILWEWDFSYEEDEGFQAECDERDPSWQFNVPGTYLVQLQVTDRSSFIDLLNDPIEVEVVENYAPEITAVNHSRTTSQAGNIDEAVQLSVEFVDTTPLDDTHTFLWECDYGSFDDPLSRDTVWYPPDEVMECDITVQVTDWFGLSDYGSCHQWTTNLPVFDNTSTPGNILISQGLDTAFDGIIDPADFIFPNDTAGNVVFISYWATYSGTSVDGMPLLVDLYDQFENYDYVHLMINEGEDSLTVTNFVNLNLCRATYWPLDTDASYFNQTRGWVNNSDLLPQHMLFDRDGRCRWYYVGLLTSTTGLENAIIELL